MYITIKNAEAKWKVIEADSLLYREIRIKTYQDNSRLSL